jgi:hypothetical protein
MPLDITEYRELATDSFGHPIPTGVEPANAQHQVAITGGSVQSSGLAVGTRLVRLHTDVACRVEFGKNPTATSASKRLAANSTEFFGVRQHSDGSLTKIAVISST